MRVLHWASHTVVREEEPMWTAADWAGIAIIVFLLAYLALRQCGA